MPLCCLYFLTQYTLVLLLNKKLFCEQKEYAGSRRSAWYASGFMCGLLNSAYYVDLSV